MSVPVLYGQAQSEKRASENEVCRQIVHEVINFGVTERQLMYVIYLLSLTLENGENMRSIAHLIRDISGGEAFLIGNRETDVGVDPGI